MIAQLGRLLGRSLQQPVDVFPGCFLKLCVLRGRMRG